MRGRLHRLWLTLCLFALGCAARPRAATTTDPREGAFFIVHGSLEFHAEFRGGGRSSRGESLARPGLRGLSHVRVCLARARGVKDFRLQGVLDNDEVVGCTVTNDLGEYGIAVDVATCPRRGCGGRYYLVTDLCTWHSGHTQTCPALNVKLGRTYAKQPWNQEAQWRKFMWTRTYTLPNDANKVTLGWNLSCPARDGLDVDHLVCPPQSLEPSGRFASTNSNFGFNKEAIHAAQASAFVVGKLGDLQPGDQNTLQSPGKYCGGPKDHLAKKKWFCQDAIRIVIKPATRMGGRDSRPCQGDQRAHFTNPRTVCTESPTNAAVLIHEIGHVLHVRFMNYRGGVNATDTTDWTTGAAQKSQTGEGFANFFSAAILFPADAAHPDFNGREIEDRGDGGLRGTCSASAVSGEGHMSQFFWDLYDPSSEGESWDNISVDLPTLLEVWSLFAGPHGKYRGDRLKGECDPHGRNAWDFAYYFGRYPGELGDIRAVLEGNCVDRHVSASTCP